MAAVTVHSDFGAPQNKVCHCCRLFPFYLPGSDGTGCHDLNFLECCVLSQLFHSPLSLSSRGSLVPLRFLPSGCPRLFFQDPCRANSLEDGASLWGRRQMVTVSQTLSSSRVFWKLHIKYWGSVNLEVSAGMWTYFIYETVAGRKIKSAEGNEKPSGDMNHRIQ